MALVLGLVVAILGFAFVLIGVNALTGDEVRRRRPPVPGSLGTGKPASPTQRRIVAVGWVVLGVLFVVAAFTHQVP